MKISIDFGKFKRKPKNKQEIAEEKVADIESDKIEFSDKSDNSPNYNIISDQLRAIYVLLTGKTNRKYTNKWLKQEIIYILKS
ncbi:MAG: hypothetical protein GF317_13550 [Candidatus Lokiarchaeota archaeon]|nr:hypothetical protein [Candidatus Lokiarchaeota archaeon]MBD3200666.1 hypothetical protein [Candidatus Lokiarchaeota archaeon]